MIMVLEGALLGFAGGVVGCLSAALFFHWNRFTLGNEGLTLALSPSFDVAAYGLLVALVLGCWLRSGPRWFRLESRS